MFYSRLAATSRGLLGLALLAGCGLVFVGCGDNSTGTAPALTPADIEKQQAKEMEARLKAFGKEGAPHGKKGAKAAKAPKAEEAPKTEEKPAP